MLVRMRSQCSGVSWKHHSNKLFPINCAVTINIGLLIGEVFQSTISYVIGILYYFYLISKSSMIHWRYLYKHLITFIFCERMSKPLHSFFQLIFWNGSISVMIKCSKMKILLLLELYVNTVSMTKKSF